MTTALTHGDGRFASRFRPDYDPHHVPRVVGLCVACRRTMWTDLGQESRRGRLSASIDGRHCNPCLRYIRDTGSDPRFKKGAAAEVIPAEWPEGDTWWRDSGLPRCADTDDEAFEPDPLPEDMARMTDTEKDSLTEMRRYVAAFVCGPCPVMEECRQAARVHGYEGMWGGRFFTRNAWVDPLTGLRGPTLHTPLPKRREMVARLARHGYDVDGEPITGQDTA